MYINRVKNDRKFFEIPTLLSCQRENPEHGNSKQHIHILNFPSPFSAEFPHSQLEHVLNTNTKSFIWANGHGNPNLEYILH